MDKIVSAFSFEADGDLALCLQRGVAYQRDMKANRAIYDSAYFEKCAAYEYNQVAQKVNAGRCALLEKQLRPGASVLDIGVGSGAFLKLARQCGFDMKGFDVMPEAIQRLKASREFSDCPTAFDALTLWDSIEHMEFPATHFKALRAGTRVFISTPIFKTLRAIRDSKHYRPGEHLYYWTAAGLIGWMELLGFRCIEESDHERQAGRDSIGAFVFVRGTSP